MQKYLFLLSFSVFAISLPAQLTIDQIMADPKISVGALPSNIFWSDDSKTVYFKWNPENRTSDSLYAVTTTSKKPVKVAADIRRSLPSANAVFNPSNTQKVYTRNGDIFLLELGTGISRTLTNTLEEEMDPSFSAKGDKVLFTKNNNLFSISINTGELIQLTNFQAGYAKSDPRFSGQERWLKQDQIALFDILNERSDKKKRRGAQRKSRPT